MSKPLASTWTLTSPSDGGTVTITINAANDLATLTFSNAARLGWPSPVTGSIQATSPIVTGTIGNSEGSFAFTVNQHGSQIWSSIQRAPGEQDPIPWTADDGDPYDEPLTQSATNTTVVVGAKSTLGGTVPPGTIWNMDGTWTISPNNKNVLIAQGDGNLVLYEVEGPAPTPFQSFQGRALWSSGTAGRAIGGTMAFQTDGNLVVYDSKFAPVWASGPLSNSVENLRVQDDGNLVIYQATPLWASNTSDS